MKPKWKRLTWLALVAIGLVFLAVVIALESGVVERWARDAIVRQLETVTGGQVELDAFRFHLLTLDAELRGLTIHGLEPEGTPPLFHVDSLSAKVRLSTSLRHRQLALSRLDIERPEVHVRVDQHGRSNVPSPKHPRQPATRPWHERLFQVTIGRLRLTDGYALYNDVRVPLVAEGNQFDFAMDYYAPPFGEDYYRGALAWNQIEVAARRYLPFPSDLTAKFTLTQSHFELSEFRLKLPHTAVDARAELASFTKPNWTFQYRVSLDLVDIRTILRKPHSPGGQVESTGTVHYGGGQWDLQGYYHAKKISMPYKWFHAQGMESRGTLAASGHALAIPDFQAWALGGQIAGRVDYEFHGQHFRADTRARELSLSAVLAAVDNKDFPMHTLHWNAGVNVDSVTTWTADFKHVVAEGQSLWSPQSVSSTFTAVNQQDIPAGAQIQFKYEMDSSSVALRQSEITTPTTRIEMDGVLGARNSALAVKLNEENLLVWDDFINYMRKKESQPERIAGRAIWNGSVLGELARPTFQGHVQAFQAQYGRLNWDDIEGDLTYSPDEFRLSGARLCRGRSTADLELALELDDWSFLPENRWTLQVRLEQADTDDLQGLFGSQVPARGVLTGNFEGSGTHSEPQLHGNLSVTNVSAWNFHFDQVRAVLDVGHGQVRITRAELRQDSGRISGNLSYVLDTDEVTFNLTGSALPLEKIQPIQTHALSVGGMLDFDVQGHGPWAAPAARGSFRVANLRVGKDVLGNFAGRLSSGDRRVLHLDLNSAMNTGKLGGWLELTVAGNYPLEGELTMEEIDLNPFIAAGLHLTALTGHSSVSGRLGLSGSLRAPETIAVQADISSAVLEYANVKLQNVGPVRLVYRKTEVRIQQAELRGAHTDLTITGSVRFDQNRPIDFNLAGAVDLQLLGGLFPQLDARGTAQVNAKFQGTLWRPRIIGHIGVQDGSATYGDFPTGLSQVNGEFVFDSARLSFENVTATAGSGTMRLSGSVAYGEDRFSYDIKSEGREIRVRYPEGMSWLLGGDLELTGTRNGAELSGRVVVHRLLMTKGFSATSMIIGSREVPRLGTAGRSSFLSNLRFDLEVASAFDARVEWTGTRVDTEGTLHVRGTWDHPSILGHIHLLSGEVLLRGNRYRLTRGDVNFSNPFRPDPILDIEATSTIQQYEVTLEFTGSASAPKLSYRSDPPLPETDVITLLALGHTGPESGVRSATGGSASQSGAGALLSEAIASQVGGRLERLFGISRLQVDPFAAGVGTQSNAATRITVQQQVTPDLSIIYSTNAASNPEQVIQVEYAVSRDVSFVGLRDINGTFGLYVKFKTRFK